MNKKQELLSRLPSVDEVLKSEHGTALLRAHPRKYVLTAVRDGIDLRRKEILEGTTAEVSLESMLPGINHRAEQLSSYSLRPLINATGVVIHTNLGRSILSEKAIENVERIARGYSNLEYNLAKGERGKRYAHIKRLLREITGAEDGLAVNNNAAAVLLCLSTCARGKEVVVSRGELVEIGGSFRIPEVMSASGALLREVGTTNKTHLPDYENALQEHTALILKVHQANYRIIGFTEEVPIEKLVALGKSRAIPVMYDLGSGCLVNLRPYGIHTEPTVQEVVRSGVELVTFSGDKLLGGPQAGLIVGKKAFIEQIQNNPLTRAVRIDKLTLAALEATLMEYVDEGSSNSTVPTVRMLLEEPERIRSRAKKMATALKREVKNAEIEVHEDASQAGGGSLPEINFPTYVVSIRPEHISVNVLEERLRKGMTPIITRLKENAVIIDLRTVTDQEAAVVIEGIKAALRQG